MRSDLSVFLFVVIFVGVVLLVWPWLSWVQLIGLTLIYWPLMLILEAK